MSKKVVIPTRASSEKSADQWIQQSGERSNKPTSLRRKRLTIDMDQEMHRELKMHCVATDQEIASFVRGLIKRALISQS